MVIENQPHSCGVGSSGWRRGSLTPGRVARRIELLVVLAGLPSACQNPDTHVASCVSDESVISASSPALLPYRVLVVAGTQMRDAQVIWRAGDFGDVVALLEMWGVPFDLLRLEAGALTRDRISDDRCRPRYGAIIWTARQGRQAGRLEQDSVLRLAVDSLGISLIAIGDKIREPVVESLLGIRFRGMGPVSGDVVFSEDRHFLTRELAGERASHDRVFPRDLGPHVLTVSPDVDVLAQAGRWPQLVVRTVRPGVRTIWIGGDSDSVFRKSPTFLETLRRAIVWSIGYAVYKDYGRSLILRVDDMGNAQNSYLDYWSSVTLDEEDIDREIIQPLIEHDARLSVMFVPGYPWIPTRTIERSVTIDFVDHNGVRQDYTSTYRGLRRAVEAGVVSVEAHGLTHQAPNLEGWWSDANERSRTGWYREFYDVRRDQEVDRDVQLSRLRQAADWIEQDFGERPVAFTPPGYAISGDYFLGSGASVRISQNYTYRIAAAAGFGVASGMIQYSLGPDHVIALEAVRTVSTDDGDDHVSDRIGALEATLSLYLPAVFPFHDRDIDIPMRSGEPGQLRRWLEAIEARFGQVKYMTLAEWSTYLHTEIEVKPTPNKGLEVVFSCRGPRCRYFHKYGAKWTLHLADELREHLRGVGPIEVSEDGSARGELQLAERTDLTLSAAGGQGSRTIALQPAGEGAISGKQRDSTLP